MAKRKRVPAWRRRYLAVLARTDNGRLAALQAGVCRTSVDYQCKRDPRFAAQCAAARAKGKAAVAAGRATRPRKASVELVWQNRRDGPRYVRAAEGRWSDKVEDAFLAALERTGCIRWAAAAVRFSTTTIYYRQHRYPQFAARCAAAEARARERIPAILTAATIASFDPGIDGEGLPPVNVDQAIQIARLKCGESGAGRKRSRYAPPEPTIEEVRDEIKRRLAAIRRHREKGQGDSPPPLDGEG